jgi:hypothetical protein
MPRELELDFISHKLISIIESIKNTNPISSYFLNGIYEQGNKLKKKVLSRILKKPHWYC